MTGLLEAIAIGAGVLGLAVLIGVVILLVRSEQ